MTDELRALKMVGTAVVYKKDRPAARLRRAEFGIEFSYLDAYLSAGHEPVATSLPLSDQPVRTPAGAVPPFFAGLLPEGRRLSALRAAVKTSADDELSLLLAIGGDTIGDVRVLPEGKPPDGVRPRVEVADWSTVSFAEVFAADTGAEPDRIGLPGVQPKASAQMISIPVVAGADRYILKLDPPEFPHLCRNESLMLRAARQAGLQVASAELRVDREGREGLIVRRFDRAGGGLLAVEDGCQVLGRYPADKYALTTEQVCTGLSAATDAPVVAARTYLRWVTFAYLTCNGDLHAKNLSVAEQPGGVVQPSPAYDLPSSYPYGDSTMALTIAGKDREDIGRDDMMKMAGVLGVADRAARKVLDEVVGAVDRWIDLLPEAGFDGRTTTKWRRAIEYRARRLG